MIIDTIEERHLQQDVSVLVEKAVIEFQNNGKLQSTRDVKKLRESIDGIIKTHKPSTAPHTPSSYTARAVREELLSRMATFNHRTRFYHILENIRDRIKETYLPRGNVCPHYSAIDAPTESIGSGLSCFDCGESGCYKGSIVTAGLYGVDEKR